ncbi:MAG: biotin/lipoyl-containing protein, partial [Polyangia bacterium]
MAFEFRLPDIGEGVVEGEVVKWHLKAGDPVAEDQPMVEVMTDKATVEIPSPKAGTIREIRAPEGKMCAVGAVMVVIDEA